MKIFLKLVLRRFTSKSCLKTTLILSVSKTLVFENKVKGPILLKIIDSIGKNGQMIVFPQKNDARPLSIIFRIPYFVNLVDFFMRTPFLRQK